jgi:hypothetical protein
VGELPYSGEMRPIEKDGDSSDVGVGCPACGSEGVGASGVGVGCMACGSEGVGASGAGVGSVGCGGRLWVR